MNKRNKFFWQDKSGRGFSNTFNTAELIDCFNCDETNWDGKTIKEWLDSEPDEGDVWENEANKVTRIK